MPSDIDWLIIGDFNLYRNLEDRNNPGADYNEMLLFNEAISMLGLVELPLKGKCFTWTNKQLSPILERLDWFFTSTSWTLSYPNSFVTSMSTETSNHTPCLISINTVIPRGHVFRFENFWMLHEVFFNQV
jgi:endonuclease/exonuclease/phosphatase family metal-dependent hydrolase